MAYAAFDAGLPGVGTAAAGWLAGAALFFPFFALGGMGAGDVKLLAALGRLAWPGRIGVAGDVRGDRRRRARAGGRAQPRLPAHGRFESLADADALADAGPRAGTRLTLKDGDLAAAGLRDSDHDRSVVHLMATLNTDRRQGERGQAIIELALTLPLLLLVVLGVFDFGLMFQRFEVVTNAAREGARVAVLPDYTDRGRRLSYLTPAELPAAGGCSTGALVRQSRCAVRCHVQTVDDSWQRRRQRPST